MVSETMRCGPSVLRFRGLNRFMSEQRIGWLILVMMSVGVVALAEESLLPASEVVEVGLTTGSSDTEWLVFDYAMNQESELVESNTNESEIDTLDPESVTAFGTKGSWRWALYGGVAVDLQSDGEQYNVTWAAEYFLVDDLSVNFELNGLYFDQPSNRLDTSDTGAINGNILFRWHFWSEERWSLYADGGVGVLLAGDEIPVGGTNYNFTPQAGIGLTVALDEPLNGPRFMTGVRWHHISNARTKGHENNPGRDAAMIYAGFSFPF